MGSGRVDQLLQVAREQSGDPVVAYLIAGTAFEHAVQVLAARQGVHGQFSLRQNGTLRLRKVGEVKMPEVYPPRPEHQLRAALTSIRPEDQERLLALPGVVYFARRVPQWNGKPLVSDARRQRLTGVVDVARTLDPRYPVWCSIDARRLRDYLDNKLETADREALTAQVVELIRVVYQNLLSARGPDQGEDSHDTAAHALPILLFIVDALCATVKP